MFLRERQSRRWPSRSVGAILFDMIPIAHAERTCGGCTACCDGWLTGNILGHELAPGKPCHFRGDGGCTIYDARPADPCRGFVCGWLVKGSPFPESFRPDRLGVIIVIKPWRDRFAYVLVPAGRSPDAKLLEWMRAHSTATGRPFLFHLEGRQRGYGSAEFQKEILDKSISRRAAFAGAQPRWRRALQTDAAGPGDRQHRERTARRDCNAFRTRRPLDCARSAWGSQPPAVRPL